MLKIVSAAFLLWFANEIVNCRTICKKNQYIVDSNGTEYCLTCNDCTEGRGLFPPCGSKIDHPPSSIDCVPCVAGKTYSDDHGPSSCKNCHLCSAHEIVTKACTINENTVCSNTCVEGYYFENSTHNCQRCSDCCHDGKDITIKKCKSMQSNKQCSVHDPQRCKKGLESTTIAASYPTTTAASTASTSTSKTTVGMIVGISCAGLFGAILIILLLCCIWRCSKTKKQASNNPYQVNYEQETGHIEDGVENHLLGNGYDICDINHTSFVINNKTQTPVFEGQTISLSLNVCDNQNGEHKANTKCRYSFEWLKDGDCIPKNNNNNYCNNSEILQIENAEPANSGRYCCKIHCDEHPNHTGKSNPVVIRVEPGEGKDWMLFRDLDHHSLVIEGTIANHLTPKTPGIGNWMELGREFNMEEHVLKSLEKDQASQVLEHIKAAHPNLTVFEFCEVMKKDSMKQNIIVDLLKNYLTTTIIKNTKTDTVYRPDSGICEDAPLVPLKVDLPPPNSYDDSSSKPINNQNAINHARLNISFADSSREASRESSLEDLPRLIKEKDQKNSKPMDDKGNKLGNKSRLRRKKSVGQASKSSELDDDDKDVQDDTDKGKRSRRLSRQMSKDSQKSVEGEEDIGRERKRSRSSSIGSIISGVLKQPSKDYSPLDQHHEESDEGGL